MSIIIKKIYIVINKTHKTQQTKVQKIYIYLYDDDVGFGWSLGPTLVFSFRYTTMKLCILMR
jgi:hypothetical protein